MQRELGKIFDDRFFVTGSEEDRKMAIKWYSEAAKHDDSYSKQRLESGLKDQSRIRIRRP